jgi:hypothetical protein
MNSIVKKVVAFSLIGLMQAGLVAPVVTEASSRNDRHYERRYENHDNGYHRGFDKDREHRLQEERERHEREMERHDYESDWEYHERMEREKEHHEELMRMIGGFAILSIILNNDDHD